jgi:low affinity Fe/Cu permease
MNEYIAARFDDLSNWISMVMGSPRAFLIALFLVLAWLLTGPFFHFSDTWQLIINTGTTIVTFLMVFLLQNTGNRTIDEMHERLRLIERQNESMLIEMGKMNKRD